MMAPTLARWKGFALVAEGVSATYVTQNFIANDDNGI